MRLLCGSLLWALGAVALRVDDDGDAVDAFDFAHVDRRLGESGRTTDHESVSPRRALHAQFHHDNKGQLPHHLPHFTHFQTQHSLGGPHRRRPRKKKGGKDDGDGGSGGAFGGVEQAGKAIVSAGTATKEAGETAATKLAQAGESAREAGQAAVQAFGDTFRKHVNVHMDADHSKALKRAVHATTAGGQADEQDVAESTGEEAGELAFSKGMSAEAAAHIAFESAKKAGGSKTDEIWAAGEVAGQGAATQGDSPQKVAQITARAVEAAGASKADIVEAAGIAAGKVAAARGLTPAAANRVAEKAAAAAATAEDQDSVNETYHRAIAYAKELGIPGVQTGAKAPAKDQKAQKQTKVSPCPLAKARAADPDEDADVAAALAKLGPMKSSAASRLTLRKSVEEATHRADQEAREAAVAEAQAKKVKEAADKKVQVAAQAEKRATALLHKLKAEDSQDSEDSQAPENLGSNSSNEEEEAEPFVQHAHDQTLEEGYKESQDALEKLSEAVEADKSSEVLLKEATQDDESSLSILDRD